MFNHWHYSTCRYNKSTILENLYYTTCRKIHNYCSALIILCMMFFLLCGCRPHADNVDESPIIRDFFDNYTPDEQIDNLKKFSIEEQYNLYIWGKQVLHPSAGYLAFPFAEQGPIIIPYLTDKLNTTKDDHTIRDISFVLKCMSDYNKYDFSNDAQLMDLLDRRVNSMKEPWKDVTQKYISDIRKNMINTPRVRKEK
jgi:hypothetical protein